ncbi:MAG: type II secretion system protein GspG [Opitutaceae bacterium]
MQNKLSVSVVAALLAWPSGTLVTQGYLTWLHSESFPNVLLDNSNEIDSDIAKVFLDQGIKLSLTAYKMDVGHYPTTEEGLDALIKAPIDTENDWKGPYLDSLPKDPWGMAYSYKSPGVRNTKSYDVASLGPDRVPSADDIQNQTRNQTSEATP